MRQLIGANLIVACLAILIDDVGSGRFTTLRSVYGIKLTTYDINELNRMLRSAAIRGKDWRVAALVRSGADVNWEDEFGRTALRYAVRSRSGNKKAVAECLIRYGADVEARAGTRWTLLHDAAWSDLGDIAELLIANGADVNARASDGKTPLHLTLVKSNVWAAKVLVANGADVNARDEEGLTPLDKSGGEIRDLLRHHGAKTGQELDQEAK